MIILCHASLSECCVKAFSFYISFIFVFGKIISLFCSSGNYGGALGANAFAKGLEGNKSLKVLSCFHVLIVLFVSILPATIKSLKVLMQYFSGASCSWELDRR